MDKSTQLTFFASELNQFFFLLDDPDIHGKVSSFLLRYVSLEAHYKKMLISKKEKTGEKLTEKKKKQLSVTAPDVKRVLAFFEIEYDNELIERVFGSNDKNYRDCSIKKLRDRLVHSVNENVLRAILERYDEISHDLDAVTELFTRRRIKK